MECGAASGDCLRCRSRRSELSSFLDAPILLTPRYYPKAQIRQGADRDMRAKQNDGPGLVTTSFHACCGVVSNGCCDVSAPRGAVFKLSPAPLPPPKPAIACTS